MHKTITISFLVNKRKKDDSEQKKLKRGGKTTPPNLRLKTNYLNSNKSTQSLHTKALKSEINFRSVELWVTPQPSQ